MPHCWFHAGALIKTILISRCWSIVVDVEAVNQNVKTAWSLDIVSILEFTKLSKSEGFGDSKTQ